MAEYDILVSCPAGLPLERVAVEFDKEHDRKPHPDPGQEEPIEETWQAKKSRNPSLYNGTKFRYAGQEIVRRRSDQGDGQSAAPGVEPVPAPDDADIDRVVLKLGLTDYRSFVGTNLREEWEALLVPGDSDAERCVHLADPLGNAALVRTADEKVLLLQRGQNVGEFPDCPVFPGGHPEPVEAGVSEHTQVLYTDDERNQRNTLVAIEMFDGILREVEEETGAPADSLSNLRFVGLCRRTKNARPVAMFVCDCALTAPQVLERYATAEHKFESTRLRAVLLEELPDEAKAMPGCHQGGCKLALAHFEYLKACKGASGQGAAP